MGDGYGVLSYGEFVSASFSPSCFLPGSALVVLLFKGGSLTEETQIHQNMVPLRPEVHCPHIGPSGGGMCVDDRTYVGNLEENYFVNTPFLAPGLEGGVFT
jgi:hypothetical protein